MVELKKITLLCDSIKECIDLEAVPEKKDFAYTAAIILALGYEYNSKGKPMDCFAIYADGKMVGLISYHYYVMPPVFKETCYRIRPFFVDKNHLGKGYEAAALQKLLEIIRTKPHGEAAAVFATYDPEEEDMEKLYEAAGFVKTDMDWEDEGSDDNDVIVRMSI